MLITKVCLTTCLLHARGLEPVASWQSGCSAVRAFAVNVETVSCSVAIILKTLLNTMPLNALVVAP